MTAPDVEPQTAPPSKTVAPPPAPSVTAPPGATWPLRVARWIVAVATVVGLATLLFSFLGRWIYWAELVCNFRLQLIGAIGLLLAAQMSLRQWRWAALSAAAIVFGGMAIWQTCLPDWSRSFTISKGGHERVMSFNVLGTNRSVDDVIALVQHRKPEVFIALEYSNHWHQGLKPLHDEYPYRILKPRWHGFGIGVFSRHPIVDQEIVQLARGRTDAPMVVATIAPPDGPAYRILGVHLLAPMSPERLEIRNREIEDIQECVLRYRASGIPSMVIGDFNCVPWSPYLRDMLRTTQMQDSRQSHGYQGTWPAQYPVLRIPIDHCFVESGIRISDRDVLDGSCGSDHLPLVVEFEVAAQPPAANQQRDRD